MAPPEVAGASLELAEYARRKQAQFRHSLRSVLLSTGPKRPATLTLDTYVDAESRFARENDLSDTLLVLVRPDGYISWVGERITDELDEYLNRWLR